MSMSAHTTYSGQITTTDDFFTRWLKRLYQSLEALDKDVSAPTLSSAVDIQPETKSLVSKVIAIIDEGQGNLPKWLSSLRKERGDLYKKIMSMITIGEDLKTKLGKLRTPNAMQDLKDIHLRYVDLLSNKDTQESSVATTAAPSSSSSSIPLYDYADQTREPIDKVLNFLSTIEETTGDNVLEFCRLADANHRYHAVTKLDDIRVKKLLDIEKARETSSATSISLLEKRQRSVTSAFDRGNDTNKDDAVVQQGLELIEKELSVSYDALRSAESVEEQARVAYERACQIRKKAASKVSGLVDTVTSVQTHKKLIADVSSKRLDLAKVNQLNAAEGIALLSEFQAYMQSVQSQVGGPQVDKEIPAIFSHLITSFTSFLSTHLAGEKKTSGQLDQFNVVMGNQIRPYFTHFVSQPVEEGLINTDQTLRCLAQIGLEMTRLWRQLNADDTYSDAVWATITKFEQEIQTKFLKQLSPSPVKFPLRDDVLKNKYFQGDTEHIPRYQDTTVVLHYDHLQHLTPKWHFENIHRMSAAMKMIVDQKARPVNYDTTWLESDGDDAREDESFSAGPSKKHCRRGRELELLSCNDVVAPPLWTLPMTHSPIYLQHLYEVAIMAQEEDIYAPLEFESDFDDDDDEEVKDPPPDLEDKKFVLSLNSDVSRILGPELEAHFLSILKIDKKDSVLANTLSQSKKTSKKNTSGSEGASNTSKFVSGRVGHDTGITFTGGNNNSGGNSGNGKQGHISNRQVSTRVVTPYGMGVIIERIRESDGMQKVSLDWGATCVFNSFSIQMITDSQQMKDSVGNVLPPHIRYLLTAWRESRSKEGGDEDSAMAEEEEEVEREEEGSDVMDVEGGQNKGSKEMKRLDVLISPFMKFIVNCLANLCGVQRLVADLFRINPSTFSAWLNGRASDSMCDSATKSAKSLLARYSYDTLVRRLMPGEDPSEEDSATSDNDEGDEGVGEEEEEEVDKEEDSGASASESVLKVKMSATPIPTDKATTKVISPRSASSVNFCPHFEYDMYSLTNFDGYKGQIAQRPSKETSQSEQIRASVRSLMARDELTEGHIAQEFSMKFEPTKPGTIVSWLNYRTTYQMDAKLNFYMFLWIEERRSSLTTKENKAFEELRMFVESTSNANNENDNYPPNANINEYDDVVEEDHGANEMADDENDDNEDNETNEDNMGIDVNMGGDMIVSQGVSFSVPEIDIAGDVAADLDSNVDVNDSRTLFQSQTDDHVSITTDPSSDFQNTSAVQQDSHSPVVHDDDDGRENDEMEVEEEVELTRGQPDDSMDLSEVSDNEQDFPNKISAPVKKEENCGSEKDGGVDQNGEAQGRVDEDKDKDNVISGSGSGSVSHPTLPPGPLPLSDINTLRFTIIDEIMRRNISQTTVAEEANLCIIGLSQGAISKLLHKGSFGSGTKALKFKNLMEDWVGNSKLQPDGEQPVRRAVTHTLKKEISELDIKVPGHASSGGVERTITPKTGTTSDKHTLDGGEGMFPEAKAKEKAPLNPECSALRDALTAEMKRRGCYQSHVIEESGLSMHGFSQPNISRFIHSVYLMGGERGLLFKQMVKKWIKWSQRKYPSAAPEVTESSVNTSSGSKRGSGGKGEQEIVEEESDFVHQKSPTTDHGDEQAGETKEEEMQEEEMKVGEEEEEEEEEEDKEPEQHEELMPVLQLRKEVMTEIHRRAMSQRGAAIEAKFEKNGLPLCTVNRLINASKCNNDSSGIKFRKLMQIWLITSRANEITVNNSPPAPDDEEEEEEEEEEDNAMSEGEENTSVESKVTSSLERERSREETEKYLEVLHKLQAGVRAEIQRRNVYQAFVAKEAKLSKIGCDQSHLSRFLLGCRMPGYGRADNFREYMTNWLEESRLREGGAGEKVRAGGSKGEGEGSGSVVPKPGANQNSSRAALVPRPLNQGVIYVEGLMSSEDLQLEVNTETYRRSVSISTVFLEADIASSTVSNSALARYLQKGNCPVGERGIVFRTCLEKWLKVSKKKPESKTKTVKDRTQQQAATEVVNTTMAVSQVIGSADDYERRHSQRRKASSISSQNSEDGYGEMEDDVPPPMKQARRQTGAGVHASAIGIGMGEGHVPLIRAERFKENFHHPFCKECNSAVNQPGTTAVNMLECGSCPYRFHTGCADSSSASYLPHIPSNFSNSQQGKQWFCSHCRETGACFGRRLKTGDINSPTGLVRQPWILLYASHLRRWRQGYVCDMDVTRKLLLCKWWRTDHKWGKSNWIDISNGAPILWTSRAADILDVNNEKSAKMRKAAEQELRRTHPQYFDALAAVQAVQKMDAGALAITARQQQQQQQQQRVAVVAPPVVQSQNASSSISSSNNNNNSGSSSSSSSRYRDRSSKAKEEEKEEPVQSNIDTFLSADSLKAACCAAGIACRAVDVVMCGSNTNAFVCSRPPGHHAGRKGFTEKCRGTGFCLLNNAAIAMLYARVRWGVQRVAVVDIDVHFGNGTSELLKNDPRAFFGCVHMIYGEENEGFSKEVAQRKKRMAACCGPNAVRSTHEVMGSRSSGAGSVSTSAKEKNALDRIESFKEGFFPHALGCTDIQDNYMSVGVYPDIHNNISSPVSSGSEVPSGDKDDTKEPEQKKPFPQASLCGPAGFRKALKDYIIPQMEKFDPELLIISAGFDGLASDPLGGDLGLSTSDFTWATHALLQSMNRSGGSGHGRVLSLLEGGYDIKRETLGLACSIDAHVKALRKAPVPTAS